MPDFPQSASPQPHTSIMKHFFAALLFGMPAGIQAATVYSNNFENEVIPPEFSGAGNLSTSGGLSNFGFGLMHLHNPGAAATQMSLLGLAPHTSITLTFDLAMWDSIDLGGDQFVVSADGVDLYNSNSDFGNFAPSDNVGHGPGINLTAPFSDRGVPDYGQNTEFRDSARHVVFSFPHSAQNLTVLWSYPNSQGAPDESFGIDNVLVEALGVPEPSAAAFFGLLLGVLLRRRR